MTSQGVKCPTCYDWEAVHRSHLKLRDLPFLLVGMRAYRCLLCYRRFHTWKRPPSRVRVKPADGGA
jgi:hypothetical protein